MGNSINANWLGKLYDWGSLDMNILGSKIIGFDSLDIKFDKESPNIYGASQQPVGYYGKNYVYDCSVGFLYDKFSEIRDAALAAGLQSVMDIPPFIIVTTLGFSTDPLVTPRTKTVLNCRFTSDSFVIKQNTGGIYQVYKIACAGIIDA